MGNLVVLLTYGLSLETWKNAGLLDRELQIYQKMAAAKNVRIYLLTYGDHQDLEIGSRYPELTIIPAYHFLNKPRSSILRALKSFFIFYSLKKHLPPKYVIKTNQMFGSWVALIPAFLGAPLTTRCGYELLWTHLRESKGFVNKWSKAMAYYLVEAFAYTFSKKIILTTEHAANFVKKSFPWINTGKISVIPNYIDTESFSPKEKSPLAKTVLFVGRLNRIKNLDSLFTALKGTDWSLDVVGQGELESELKARVESEKIPVRFLGVFPNHMLPEIYGNYNFFILPSLFENNPKTLMEAMASGLVSCGTSAPGIKSLVQDSNGGLLAESPKATAIHELLLKMSSLNQEQVEQYKSNARNFATANFSLHTTVEKEFLIHQENLSAI